MVDVDGFVIGFSVRFVRTGVKVQCDVKEVRGFEIGLGCDVEPMLFEYFEQLLLRPFSFTAGMAFQGGQAVVAV